jgi:hypothetical protein
MKERRITDGPSLLWLPGCHVGDRGKGRGRILYKIHAEAEERVLIETVCVLCAA